MTFYWPVQMYGNVCCNTRSITICGGGVSRMLNILRSGFYVMGKALTDELFCTWTGLVPKVSDSEPLVLPFRYLLK